LPITTDTLTSIAIITKIRWAEEALAHPDDLDIDSPTFCRYNKYMKIEFDQSKRDKTFRERGLDFARATEVFSGVTVTVADTRQDYGEPRWITVGLLDERTVVSVWTPRGEARRIISMRYANEREIAKYSQGME
jgi:hypothetical protein